MTESSEGSGRSVKAILFDMDGTLADTERLKAGAYTDIVAQLFETNDRILEYCHSTAHS
ncbi:MAG: hypothetical protein QGH33_10215 [Pirellulaceae bacterium]|nr:hypothetical protein [Pirellulaceae bacterium]